MLAVLALGFLIGMQHALEVDHVAAVSSLAANRRNLRSVVRHGVTWGVGHTLTLALVAGAAIALGSTIDEALAGWLEAAVGVMLVLLGGHVIWRLVADRIHFHLHEHADGTRHLHVHSHRGDPAPHDARRHVHEHAEGIPWRALAVGLMHGMAGSAALLILTVTTVGSPLLGMAYILVFGIGSIVGMGLLSAVIAVPLTLSARSLTWSNRLVRGAIGCATIAIGIMTITESLPVY
jgi:ABC-type nickel/cobalt efflux system permease component RcnA